MLRALSLGFQNSAEGKKQTDIKLQEEYKNQIFFLIKFAHKFFFPRLKISYLELNCHLFDQIQIQKIKTLMKNRSNAAQYYQTNWIYFVRDFFFFSKLNSNFS